MTANQVLNVTDEQVLSAIRHKQITGELTGEQGLGLLYAWRGIKSRLAAQVAYENTVRKMTYHALTSVGFASEHHDLDQLAADIQRVLGLVPCCA